MKDDLISLCCIHVFDWIYSKFLTQVKELILMANESCVVCYSVAFCHGFRLTRWAAIWISIRILQRVGWVCDESASNCLRYVTMINYLCTRDICLFCGWIFVFKKKLLCVTKWMKNQKTAPAWPRWQWQNLIPGPFWPYLCKFHFDQILIGSFEIVWILVFIPNRVYEWSGPIVFHYQSIKFTSESFFKGLPDVKIGRWIF